MEQSKTHFDLVETISATLPVKSMVQDYYKDKYKMALDQHAIVAVTDPTGKIIQANDMFCQLSGYSKNELVGQDHRIINSGYHSKDFFKQLWGVIASGRTWRGDICNRAKNGTEYWVKTTIVPFKNTKNQISQYISIRTDITEKIRIEKKLKSSHKRLEELYRKLEVERLTLNNKNTALNEIISHIEDEKTRIKSTIRQNIETVVLPFVYQLKSKKEGIDKKYLDLIETSLVEIAETLLPKQKDFVRILTPKEIQICNMIKSGMSAKEIAAFYSLSPRTIDKHRENIRTKLGLKAKKINLTTYLLTSNFSEKSLGN
jgi:PAS domain S-box-containing protein